MALSAWEVSQAENESLFCWGEVVLNDQPPEHLGERRRLSISHGYEYCYFPFSRCLPHLAWDKGTN